MLVNINNNVTTGCIDIIVKNDDDGAVGDIRGVFFNLRGYGIDASNFGSTSITITEWTENGETIPSGPPDEYETNFDCSMSGDFPKIPPDAQMKGGGDGGDGGREYNCAVEVRST